jgi:hypothetical protein
MPGPAPAGLGVARRVLLLYGDPRLTPAIVAVDAAIRSTIESRSPVPVTFHTEYLDLNLFDGDIPQPELRALLRRKYATRPIDLIVAAASRPLRVALHNRMDLFSGAPVVFVSVDPKAAGDLRLDADVTGTWLHMGWTQTLELARRLQPDIRRARRSARGQAGSCSRTPPARSSSRPFVTCCADGPTSLRASRRLCWRPWRGRGRRPIGSRRGSVRCSG